MAAEWALTEPTRWDGMGGGSRGDGTAVPVERAAGWGNDEERGGWDDLDIYRRGYPPTVSRWKVGAGITDDDGVLPVLHHCCCWCLDGCARCALGVERVREGRWVAGSPLPHRLGLLELEREKDRGRGIERIR